MPQQPAGFVPDGFIPDSAPPPPMPPPARMSAAAPGSALPVPAAEEPSGMTFQDLVADPKGTMHRIGETLGKDLSDPKTWMQVGLAVFGPKVFNKAAPIIARAAAVEASGAAAATPKAPGVVSRMASALQPNDVEMLPVIGKPLGQAVDFAGRMKTAIRGPVAEPVAAPPETVAGGTPPPAGPPHEPVMATAPKKSPQQMLNEEAIARRRAEYQARQAAAAQPKTEIAKAEEAVASMTEIEAKEYLKLRLAGKTDAQAREAVNAARAYNAQHGLKVPTTAETKFPKGMRGRSSPKDDQ